MNRQNFEWSKKSHIGAEEDFKGEEDDVRKFKHSKVVNQWELSHENATGFNSDDFKAK